MTLIRQETDLELGWSIFLIYNEQTFCFTCALVISPVDYCNELYLGLSLKTIQKLQIVPNIAEQSYDCIYADVTYLICERMAPNMLSNGIHSPGCHLKPFMAWSHVIFWTTSTVVVSTMKSDRRGILQVPLTEEWDLGNRPFLLLCLLSRTSNLEIKLVLILLAFHKTLRSGCAPIYGGSGC